MNKRIYTLALLLTLAIGTYGQTGAPAVADNGKFYVVVAVLSIIFTGLFIYLLILDRKVTRVEKQQKENQTAR